MEFSQTGSLLDEREGQASAHAADAMSHAEVPMRPSAASAHLSAVPAPGAGSQNDTTKVWRVQCGDVINRDRCLTVLVEGGDVVLVGPPGETARLTASQLGELRAALNEAHELSNKVTPRGAGS